MGGPLCRWPPRAARGEAAVNRRKLGVGSHAHGHFPAKVKTSLATNSRRPSRMQWAESSCEKKEPSVFVPNSRARRRQLRVWTSGAVKIHSQLHVREGAKTGHGAGSGGDHTIREKHAHGPRRFTASARAARIDTERETITDPPRGARDTVREGHGQGSCQGLGWDESSRLRAPTGRWGRATLYRSFISQRGVSRRVHIVAQIT